jgi:hypothetical protein
LEQEHEQEKMYLATNTPQVHSTRQCVHIALAPRMVTPMGTLPQGDIYQTCLRSANNFEIGTWTGINVPGNKVRRRYIQQGSACT